MSITPLGMPVVPDEYGSTAMWVAGSKLTSGGGRLLHEQLAQVRMPVGAVEDDDVVVGDADRRELRPWPGGAAG